MTRNIIGLIICLLTLTACTDNSVEIEAELDAADNSSYRIIWLASSKTQNFYGETVIAIRAGKGAVTIPTRYPSVVFVSKGSDSRPATFFWAERGDKIKISGSSGHDPLSWKISGNKINEELTEWRSANIATLGKCAFSPGAANGIIAEYVKKNSDNPVASLLLLCVYSRADNEEEFSRLWNSLGEKARDERLLAAVSRSDILSGETKQNGNLKNLTVRSLSPSGRDTLRIIGSRASILYFSGFGNRVPAATDSLNSLSKAYPDSTRRVIAEIFLEPDSTSWRRTAVGDSLSNYPLMWIPLSYADPQLAGAGVVRTGYFIVADSRGRQIFRGTDAHKASTTFRKAMRGR